MPDWENVGADVFSSAIGVLALVRRTRAPGGALGALNMALSMLTDYRVDVPEFFWTALPVNAVTLLLLAVFVVRLRDDLGSARMVS